MPQLKLFWNSVPNAASYTVFWRNSPGVTVSNGAPISGISGVVFYHTGILENTTYYYIVAAVDSNGVIGPPSVEFHARASAALSLVVTPADATIGIGGEQQYTSKVTFSDGYIQDVTLQTTWHASGSGDPPVVSIDASGLAIGGAIGTSSISGTYFTLHDSHTLVVAHNLLSIDISPQNVIIAASATQQYTAMGHFNDSTTSNITTQVTWHSTNDSVAAISNTTGSNGLATAGGGGNATISATLGFISNSTSITVTPVLQSISISPANPTLSNPSTQQFTATGHYSDSSTLDLTNAVFWQSSLTSIATINISGFLTTVSSGTTTITATLGLIVGTTTVTIS